MDAIPRAVNVPDAARIARCSQFPERGPKILFFTGGTALAKMCRRLKELTHNSVHLVTAFDSGGSSAEIRKAFGVLSIGDLRQRMMSLADETAQGNPQIYELFSHRLAADATPDALRAELERFVSGEHELIREIQGPLRRLIRAHLHKFSEQIPNDFDLARASIGNLVLCGGKLDEGLDIGEVLRLFSRLVAVRGLVLPIVEGDFHLGATLASGQRLVGQHRITGKQHTPIRSPIVDLYFIDALDDPRRAQVDAGDDTCQLIRDADLICYPPGSFYSSVLANLLVGGVGRAIADARCPKIFIPNMGEDPEQLGMSVLDAVTKLLEAVRRDAGDHARADQIIHQVAVDARNGRYSTPIDPSGIRGLGVDVVDVPLVRENGWPLIDGATLAEFLISKAATGDTRSGPP